MISVQCACGKAFMTKPANAGKKTKCPACGKMLTIPGGVAAGGVAAGGVAAGGVAAGGVAAGGVAAGGVAAGGVAAGTDEIDELLGSWPPAHAPLATAAPPPQLSAVVRDPVARDPVTSSRSNHAGVQPGPVTSSSRGNRRAQALSSESDASVLAGLFDLNFRQFITPAIIKSLYLSHLVLVAISVAMLMLFNYLALVGTAAHEYGTPWMQYVLVIFINLMVFFILFMWTLVVRLGLEAVMVLFRGEEHLRTLVELESDS